MEFQRKYDQIIYNISQLILKHKYKRAIATAEYLQNQGITNNQLLVLKSYAISKLDGYKKALDVIKLQDGPLISMAKAQYAQHLDQWQQAQFFYKNLIVEGKPAIVDALARSNEIYKNGEGTLQEESQIKKIRLIKDKPQEQCIKALNKVSEQYKDLKLKVTEGKALNQEFQKVCRLLIEKYEEIIHEYRPRRELRVAVEQFIHYLSNI